MRNYERMNFDAKNLSKKPLRRITTLKKKTH